MAQEQRLLDLLGTEQAFVITGDRLEIGDGETLALLVRPSIQPVPGDEAGDEAVADAADGAGGGVAPADPA